MFTFYGIILNFFGTKGTFLHNYASLTLLSNEAVEKVALTVLTLFSGVTLPFSSMRSSIVEPFTRALFCASPAKNWSGTFPTASTTKSAAAVRRPLDCFVGHAFVLDSYNSASSGTYPIFLAKASSITPIFPGMVMCPASNGQTRAIRAGTN